jgi:hypothetical protein
MAVIWGKKKVERKLGYIAEFCPICRTPREFEVSRVGIASHIYFISVGEGNLAGYIGRCQQCGTMIPIDAKKYKTFEEESNAAFKTLIQNTFPNLCNAYAERLDIEERLKNREPVSLPNREVWLMEPFEYLIPEVEARYANAKLDKESNIGCAVTVLLLMFLCSGFIVFENSALVQDSMFIGMGLVAIVGLIYTIVQIMLAPNRYVKRNIIPRLSQALSVLNPSKQEIEGCLSTLKIKGFRIGKKIKAEKLLESIRQRQLSTER